MIPWLEDKMNKKTLLLFLLLIICVVALDLYYYGSSLEQAVTANRELLTSQGKPKLEIESTLSVLASQYRSSFLKDILILLIGVLIGAIPTFILYRQQLINQNKEAEISIISDTLHYLFKSNNSLNNLLTDKMFLDKCKKERPQNVIQAENAMYSNYDGDVQKDFSPNLMVHSFHLKRLSESSFWKDFENLMNIYQNLTKMLMDQKRGKRIFRAG